jgi:hypothetical protein
MAEVSSLLTDEVEAEVLARNDLLVQAGPALMRLAHHHMYTQGLGRDTFVMLCIKPHPIWLPVLKHLQPQRDWESLIESGEAPVVSGSARFSVCTILSELMPKYTEEVLALPSEGHVKTIVLDETGGTVYELLPQAAKLH